MNIMITDFCNLSCKYCFATNVMYSSKEMTIDNFKKALQMLKKSSYSVVNLIGGEPTLHSKFSKILDIILDEKFEAINIFTNGLIPDKNLDVIIKLNEMIPVNLIVNLNSPEVIGKVKYDIIVNNLNILKNANVHIVLGINLYDTQMKHDFIIDCAAKLNINQIRWAVAVPNINDLKTTILDYYKDFVGVILGFLAECHVRKYNTFCDCNKIPLCAFSNEQIKEILLYQPDYFVNHKCEPVIDVDINLNAFRCFPTSRFTKVKVEEFNDIYTLKSYFHILIDRKIDNLKCGYDENCKFAYNCRGGCLSLRKELTYEKEF